MFPPRARQIGLSSGRLYDWRRRANLLGEAKAGQQKDEKAGSNSQHRPILTLFRIQINASVAARFPCLLRRLAAFWPDCPVKKIQTV